MPSTNALDVFEALIPDIWVEIFFYLSARDIVRTRLVCKRMKELTNMRPVWVNKIRTEVHGTYLQLPRQKGAVRDASTEELEFMVVKAAKLCVNMAKPVAIPVSCTQRLDQAPETVHPLGQTPVNRWITQLFFLRGQAGANWLLSVSAGFRISCWEILSDPVSALAAGRWDSPLPIVDVDANRVPFHDGTIVVTHTTRTGHEYTAVVMKVASLEPGSVPTFTTVSTISSPSGRLRLLLGNWVFFWRRRTLTCTAINWKTKLKQTFVAPASANEMDQPEPCRSVEVHNGKLILVTTEHIWLWDFDENATGSDDPEDIHTVAALRLSFSDAYPFRVEAAASIPYPREWALQDSSSGAEPIPTIGQGISVLLRRRSSPADDEVVHCLVLWDGPDETPPKIMRIRRARISTHFATDMRYAKSGRGILLYSRKNEDDTVEEGVSGFDVRRRDPQTGAVPPPGAPWRPLSRIQLPGDHQVSRCTAIDYDDAEGRAAVASSDGKITIFDMC